MMELINAYEKALDEYNKLERFYKSTEDNEPQAAKEYKSLDAAQKFAQAHEKWRIRLKLAAEDCQRAKFKLEDAVNAVLDAIPVKNAWIKVGIYAIAKYTRVGGPYQISIVLWAQRGDPPQDTYL